MAEYLVDLSDFNEENTVEQLVLDMLCSAKEKLKPRQCVGEHSGGHVYGYIVELLVIVQLAPHFSPHRGNDINLTRNGTNLHLCVKSAAKYTPF